MSSLGKDDRELAWIYIGDKTDAKNLRQICNNRIKYVMNVTPKKCDGGVSNYHERNSGLIYCRVSLQDNASEDLKLHFDKAWEFLKTAKIREDGNVLVHCNLGVSRSVALITSYLMKFHRYSLDAALALVREARPQAKPNEGFMEQLRNLEKDLSEKDGYAPSSPALRCRPLRRGIVSSSSTSSSSSLETTDACRQPTTNGHENVPTWPKRTIGPQMRPPHFESDRTVILDKPDSVAFLETSPRRRRLKITRKHS